MALSLVRKKTLAFIRGEITAEDVVRSVVTARKQDLSVEERLRQAAENYVFVEQPDTWADVSRYWGMMSEAQKADLLQARLRRFGE